ncbi:hypothetical protein ACSSVW_003819, partial [Pseudoalteromonas sp. MBR-15]
RLKTEVLLNSLLRCSASFVAARRVSGCAL